MFIHEITLLMIFFFCLLLYSIFYISFSQEETIHDFFSFTSHKVYDCNVHLVVIIIFKSNDVYVQDIINV